LYFFFCQAEDGIRDRNVTGVQTCALPILDDFAKVEPESADAMRQMIGDELSDLRIYGALDGSGTAISLDDTDLMIGFGGDEAYLSGNAIFGLLEQQSFGFSAQEEEMLNELSDEFSDSWL